MQKKSKGIISYIHKNSIAEELGLKVGDAVLAVNQKEVLDLVEFSFEIADENIELTIEKTDGSIEIFDIEKEIDEHLGIEFSEAVFDGVKCCINKCMFCFVEQMPKNCRKALYIKDDDYRLSFLYGNFITLTNLKAKDWQKIKQYHLSPLYVSVHATDETIRTNLLGLKKNHNILNDLDKMQKIGIEIHAQVVLCKGVNDGEILEKTILELYKRHHFILSLAIVPVGLTKFRTNLDVLAKIDKQTAKKVIFLVEKLQKQFIKEIQRSFVYLADEFYILADKPVPEAEVYDNYPQIENGIGMVRDFLETWQEKNFLTDEKQRSLEDFKYKDIIIVTGEAFKSILESLIRQFDEKDMKRFTLLAVENHFFGGCVDVAGLLTASDILNALYKNAVYQNIQTKQEEDKFLIVLPKTVLRKNSTVFLDNITAEDFQEKVKIKTLFLDNAQELRYLMEKI